MDASQVRAMREAQLENLGFWPEIPVIQGLAADREARLWVHRFGGVGEPGPIDVLGRDGRLRATIPAGTMDIPVAFGPGGVAAWIERGEMDVPFVRVARLTMSGVTVGGRRSSVRRPDSIPKGPSRPGGTERRD